jgi:2-polyprenyl-6-methoxyphenol hydroxylase-like FAD-dependent oxidoreductase
VRRIGVVGGGQAGLQLALGLVEAGHEVTLVSDRQPTEIREGRIMSTQCMFHDALETERELGLNLWEAECPRIEGFRYCVAAPDGSLAIQFAGRLRGYAQSVDQRLKMSSWLEELDRRGGKLVFHTADLDDLETLAAENDLVVVAAGKGEIAALFERDPSRSPFDTPQRFLAAAYVNGLDPLEPPYFSISIVPEVGEYFVGPALTLSGPCYTLCLEAIPEGPMDRWTEEERRDPDAYLAKIKETLEQFFPWEAERSATITLTDEGGMLSGAYPPVVRNAVGRLPSGRAVLGVGDTVVLNDPLVGQGANNAAKCAQIVLRKILEHDTRPFDEAWMSEVETASWDYAQWPTAFTNLMLSPPAHIPEVMSAAAETQALADVLANGTNDPSTLFPWIADPEGSRRFIDEIRSDDRARSGRITGADGDQG